MRYEPGFEDSKGRHASEGARTDPLLCEVCLQ